LLRYKKYSRLTRSPMLSGIQLILLCPRSSIFILTKFFIADGTPVRQLCPTFKTSRLSSLNSDLGKVTMRLLNRESDLRLSHSSVILGTRLKSWFSKLRSIIAKERDFSAQAQCDQVIEQTTDDIIEKRAEVTPPFLSSALQFFSLPFV
jgi:hypothetical protein